MREVCNAEWDDIQDRLKEKDAEIERLRGVVEDLSDHGVAAERMERLKAQGKEIERLKVEIFDQQEQRFWMQQRLSALLRRAADALEEFAAYISGDPDAYRYLRLKEQQLIAELRKAAQ
jgi:c-di-GMP-binding flagellar brake protein YcgR